jgi:hypothetical protein
MPIIAQDRAASLVPQSLQLRRPVAHAAAATNCLFQLPRPTTAHDFGTDASASTFSGGRCCTHARSSLRWRRASPADSLGRLLVDGIMERRPNRRRDGAPSGSERAPSQPSLSPLAQPTSRTRAAMTGGLGATAHGRRRPSPRPALPFDSDIGSISEPSNGPGNPTPSHHDEQRRPLRRSSHYPFEQARGRRDRRRRGAMTLVRLAPLTSGGSSTILWPLT